MRPTKRSGANERKAPSHPRSGCVTDAMIAITASDAVRKPPR